MIDHERAVELAAAAIDFDLAPDDAAELRSHLVTCEACRAIDDALQADADVLAGLDRLDAPAGLRERILAAAEAPESIEIMPAEPDTSRRPAILHFPARFPERFRQPALLVAAAAVIIAVVGGTLAWRTTISSQGGDVAVVDPSNPPASGSGGPGSSGSNGGPASFEPGTDLVATTWDPVAELAADDTVGGGVVGLGTTFRLASVSGTPAAVLARRLRVQPSLALSVTDEADGTVRLTPAEPLTPGAVYRFTLEGEAGETLDTWAFQARQPLRVVGTIPEDTQTDVPLDTGIEITFDQDGVVGAAAHVTIEPEVKGRFEEHDRVLVFVPEKLEPATVYTVTVSKGVTVEATGEVLEDDLRFQFETAATTEAPGSAQTTFRFATDLFESATAERPTIALWSFTDFNDETQPEQPKEVRLEVYRLADQAAAIDAFRQLRSFPRWSRWNADDRVPTEGLQRVAGFDAPLQDYRGTLWTRLPERLPAGWYLVEQPSPDHAAQAVLQVTDIAGYLVVSATQTLVWANDLASGRPVVGATVTTDATDMGRTGDDGTLLAATPASLLPATDRACTDDCEPVITVTVGTRSAFLPATGARDPDGKEGGFDSSFFFDSGDPSFWRLFHTDRTLYRRTDTINVWGALRDRDTGAVPASVTARLVYTGDGADARPPLATMRATPRATGAFTGSIALEDVPEGSYALELVVGDRVVTAQGIQVDRILKPAYRLEVVTGRRVYIAGDRIRVTATASFYEGTPVPGVPLQIGGLLDETPTTDAAGTAIVRTVANVEDADEAGSPDFQNVFVNPARPEEGEIAGASREFIVYPSSWTIAATSVVRAGRVRLEGGVNVVDVDRLEAEIADGKSVWELDPRGAPVKNRVVTATFTEIIPTKRQVDTEYDFIEKKVVPVYEYDYKERPAGTLRLRTDDLGAFSGSVAASDADHDYRIRLSVTDPDGHTARSSTEASSAQLQFDDRPFAAATLTTTAHPERSIEYGIGDRIDLTMRDPDAPDTARHDRHLYYTSQRGLRGATVRASSRYATTFADWAAPNLRIDAVRFTGSGYVVAQSYEAVFRASDRALTVGLTANAARYAPGDTVTLGVTTRDGDGHPVAATVVLRGIDEKLFSIGGAESVDPLAELYAWVDDGIRATYRSHRAPQGRPEGGDTTGGGGREDLRDSVLFEGVDTGPDGRASVTFRLSDDLTSWRVGASAVGAGLEAGEGVVLIPVGLPFFVDTSMAPEYLVSDEPAIQVRAFGSALTADDRVTFSIDGDSLGLHKDGLRAGAFETLAVPLPKLTLGTHKITVTATTGSGTTARTDRLTRSFTVVASRLTRTRTTYRELSGGVRVEGGSGLTRIVVSDASAGRLLPTLLDLSSTSSARMERALAADLAASLVADRFGGAGGDPSPPSFDGSQYQTGDGGIAVVPHASSDLDASVLAALVAPNRFDAPALKTYLRTIVDSATETRERQNFALAGLAGLGAPVVRELAAAAADPDLTIRERLLLGLGAAALGDAGTARSMATALVDEFGEADGQRARLRVGDDSTDLSLATALMAMLAAANGDPIAPRFWAYVEENPSTEAPFALHAVGYVARTLAHLAPESARFAYVIDGVRKVVELAPGESFGLAVTEAQVATLTVEPLDGKVGLTTTWLEAVDAAAFEPDPDVSIKRTVTPAGQIGADDLVVVELTITFGPKAPAGCHRVTDLVPSGLVTVGVLEGWVDPATGEPPTNVTYPLEQAGQRVVFCATPRDDGSETAPLRYVARVITTGTYTWEPAVVESRSGPDRAAVTPTLEVDIR